MAARKAVGDSGHRQQIIKTLHERGYRFVAAVDECLEHNTRDTGGVADSSRKGAGSESQAADSPLALGRNVAESHGSESSEDEAWEPKLVTVLTIDAAWPSVTQCDPLPEVPWTIVRRWQQTVGEKVQEFGGLIVQQAAAPLIAIFGIPQTIEQMPQRAVQAALGLRQLVGNGRLRDAESPGPEMRMAIHTGHVLVDVRASDPSEALLTIGDTLSRAVRLLGHAAPGEIILSPQVTGLVEGWFELRTLEGLTETGGSDTIGASAVVGLRPRRSALEVYGKRPLSRFVGRVRELAELHHRFSQVEKGRGNIVGIVGEPGVGKSRLCYEVSIRQRARRWLVLETSPVAYGKGIPYLPVVDLLKTYFRLDPGDTSRTIHGQGHDQASVAG